jgi:hypothetical protein
MASSTDFRLIVGDAFGMGVQSNLSTSQFGLGGGQIFSLLTSMESSDFQGIVGFFAGAGCPPYGQTQVLCGGGVNVSGALPGDIVFHISSTLAARPARVTLHAVSRSTANFSTGTGNSYSSTGGYDLTLSNSCTA